MMKRSSSVRTIATAPSLVAAGVLSAAFAFAAAGCKKEEKAQPQAKPEAQPEAKPEAKPEPAPAPAPAGGTNLADIAGTYQIDTGHSTVVFRTKHMEVSYTYGRFNKVTGSFTIDADPAKSSVNVEVAADSVFTASKDRDDHLRGPDFLNTKQFPTTTFKSTSVRAAGEDKYEVAGDLTLHGVTKPVTATFELVGAGPNMMDKTMSLAGFHGTLTVNRKDFGMTNMVGPVGEEIDLMIAIEGMKK